MSDPYDILGVSKDADDQDIKKAFRNLSLKYHPDRNQDEDTTKKFQEINEAYDKIKTAELRKQYESQSNPFMGHPGGMGGDEFSDINNIFNMMFGAGGMGGMGGIPGVRIYHNGPGGAAFSMFNQLHKPPSIVKIVEISMKQCYDGCSIPIEIERWVMEGNIRTIQRESIYVNVPMGIEENEFVLLQERGNVVNEQLKGDVKIGFKIRNETEFERMGQDLVYRKTISLKNALCGFSFEVRHISDRVLSIHNTNNITVVTPSYKKLVPQMGMKRNGTVGNLIIEFQIQFPERLTKSQIDALAQIL